MAFGQITLTDLNDTRTGLLSLDSNHPIFQTYDPIAKLYTPNYELENNYAVITPSFILGNDALAVSSIDYSIETDNGKITIGSSIDDGIWTEIRKSNRVLCIAKNLEFEYYHIEARAYGILDNGVPLPDFTASLTISKMTKGSKISQIIFEPDKNLVVLQQDGNYAPEVVNLLLDLTNYDFGELSKVYVCFYKGYEDDVEYIPLTNLIEVSKATDFKASWSLNLSDYEDSIAGSYMASIFSRRIENDTYELESVFTNISLLKDGTPGQNAYSLIIDDNRPVILCDEEDGIYKAQADGSETCGINVLDGKGQSVNITGITSPTGNTGNVKFTPSIAAGKANIKIEWQAGAQIEKITKKFNLTFGDLDSPTTLTASITVLPLTGGKNGEDGKDARILVLDADPTDQFTAEDSGAITIIPYFYVGGQICPEERIKSYTWTTAGIEGETSAPFYGKNYTVNYGEVQTLEVYICTVTYIEDDGTTTDYSNRISIKNTIYPYYCRIESSAGNTFINGRVNTLLTCVVSHREETYTSVPNAKYIWYTIDKDNQVEILRGEDHSQAHLSTYEYIPNETIKGTQVIYCDVLF